jgi:hypothetical protein
MITSQREYLLEAMSGGFPGRGVLGIRIAVSGSRHGEKFNKIDQLFSHTLEDDCG